MIEPMKKVCLLCLDSDKERTLEILGSLAVLHPVLKESALECADVSGLEKQLNEVLSGINVLADRQAPESAVLPQNGKECIQQLASLLKKRDELRKELESLAEKIQLLRPWGSFDPHKTKELEREGIYLLFCKYSIREKLPEDICMQEIAVSGGERYIVLCFREKPDETLYPIVQLPECSLAEAETAKDTAEKALAETEEKLSALAGAVPLLREYALELKGQLDFASARESMTNEGKVAYLTGYVPADRMAELTEKAHASGWALLAEDPDADDISVPTCIRKPKWQDIMDPLFDFIGVSPGYREHDVTLFFLLFFPLFFGMIVGDAAYGLIFMGLAVTGRILLRKKADAKLPLNLLFLLGSCAFIWGWLRGSWFAVASDMLPSFMRGWTFFADPAKSPAALKIAEKYHVAPEGLNDKFLQYFCFLLAAVHLISARLFKFVCDIRHDWREAGNIGWALVIAGNFFTAVNLIVFPGYFQSFVWWLYGIGTFLIVVTVRLGDAFNLPLDLLGSFVDVLSYIRLFAVGLSGAYIASSFNEMMLPALHQTSGWKYALVLLAVLLVAAFGHLLNIALNLLSVLVHGVRLNTLEFSKHCGLQWAGAKYEPFTGKYTGKTDQSK